MSNVTVYNQALPVSSNPVQYLSEAQTNELVRSFQDWFDAAPSKGYRRIRGRYWLTFLVLRFTGARLGEVLQLQEADLDFRNGEIRLVTLKRHRYGRKKKPPTRIVPVPANVTSEIASYLAEFPGERGMVFQLDQGNFRKVFYKRADEAHIPRDLAHPHILRHTRAIELLRSGIPVTIVQDMLGHSALTTTAIYLRISGQEAKSIMKDKGII